MGLGDAQESEPEREVLDPTESAQLLRAIKDLNAQSSCEMQVEYPRRRGWLTSVGEDGRIHHTPFATYDP